VLELFAGEPLEREADPPYGLFVLVQVAAESLVQLVQSAAEAGWPRSKIACPAGVSERRVERPSLGFGSSTTCPRSIIRATTSRSVVRRMPLAFESLVRVTGWRAPTKERWPYSSSETPAAFSSASASSSP
jgi:hypothetical protein